ncbi:hypothetical protein ACIHIX_33495 [Streptomyces sp. NPDC051913]|uniref:hypothetical protein n=1 Tax=Streptomyces sp. NPDC051913 TaxID=3365676 RepID=UPI0037D61DA3
MNGLIKQLRVSLLVVLGISAVDLVTSTAANLWSGTLLATLGDWALTTAVFCALVTLVHSAIYAAAHLGRPEGRQARGVRAGLVALVLLDQVVIWSLLTTGSAHSGMAYRAGCAL